MLFVFLLGAVYTQQFRRARGELRARSARGILAVAMLFALILRCAIALSVRGYAVDINCFEAWAYRMLHTGPLEFYSDPNYFCDYPPVYLLLLWPMEALRTAFGIAYDSNAHWLMIKLAPILFDLAARPICMPTPSKARASASRWCWHACTPSIPSPFWIARPGARWIACLR